MKILLVDNNSEDVRRTRQAIREVGEFQCELVLVGRLVDALERLRAENFDVVLLDLSLPDSEGLSTLRSIREQAPDVPVVVLTRLLDEAGALEAVRAGSHDYLIKGQVSGAGLVRCLRYAVERHPHVLTNAELSRPARTGKVLAFVGAKGGAGTTTVALNVATALAKQNRTVIAVELAPCHGTFSVQLNHVPAKNLSCLVALGPARIQVEEIYDRLCYLPFGFRVLFGPQNPAEFTAIGAEEADALVRALSQMAQFTLIDLPSQPSPMSRAVIGRCDCISMVVEQEASSVQSGKLQLELLHSWGGGKPATGAIVVDRAALLQPLSRNQISAELNCPIVGLVPSAVEEMARANRAGSPTVFSEPENPAAVALVEIAEKLLTRAEESMASTT